MKLDVRTATFVALAGCLATAAQAAAPVVDALSRRGVQRGKPTVLTVTGKNLTADTRILLPVKIDRQEVRKQPAPAAGRVDIELTVDAAAVPGVYPLRVATDDGVSGLLLFEVGAAAEIDETEPNNSPETAAVVAQLPVVINGSAAGSDVDCFKVRLPAGKRLVAEVSAQRLGGVMLPALTVHGPTGQILAAGRPSPLLGADARVVFTAPAEADYFVQVHDLLYRGGNPAHYRLRLGDYAFADGVFPLGGRRGGTVEVSFVGGTLAAPATAKVDLRLDENTDRINVRLPDSVSALAAGHVFVVGDLPEVVEADGKPLSAEGPVVLNGRLEKPGESDKWTVKLAPGKWRFEMAAANLGSSLTPVLEVNGATAPDRADSADPLSDITVGKDGSATVTVRDLHRRGGPAFGYRVTVRPVEKPDFSLSLETDVFNVPAGGTTVLRVKATRGGYNGPITLSIPGLPAGVKLDGAVMAEGQNDALLTLTAPKGLSVPTDERQVIGESDGKAGKIRRVARRVSMLAPEGGPGVSPFISAEVYGGVGKPPPVVLTATPGMPRLLAGVPFPIKLTVAHNEAAAPVTPPEPKTKAEPKTKGEPKVKAAPKTKAEAKAQAAQRAAMKAAGGADGAIGLAILTNLFGPNPQKQNAIEQVLVVAKPNQFIKAGATEGTFELTIDPKTPLGKSVELVVQATLLNAAGQPLDTLYTPLMTLTVAAPFKAEAAEKKTAAAPGAKVQVRGKVIREAGFTGPVEIRPGTGALPAGLTVQKVTVAPEKSDFALEVAVPAGAKPGDVPLALQAVYVIDPRNNYTVPLPVVLAVGSAPAEPKTPTKAEPKTPTKADPKTPTKAEPKTPKTPAKAATK